MSRRHTTGVHYTYRVFGNTWHIQYTSVDIALRLRNETLSLFSPVSSSERVSRADVLEFLGDLGRRPVQLLRDRLLRRRLQVVVLKLEDDLL